MSKALKFRSTLKKRVNINFRSLKLLTVVLLIGGLAGFGTSGYIWYKNVFSNTDRIFYGMVGTSLETDSVTRQVSQDESSRKESQTYFLSFSPQPLIESISTVEQIDQDRNKSSVTTQTIGTKEADYVAYKNINIPDSDKGQTDYSTVINVWAKRQSGAQAEEQAQFLNEAIFTFIPFGNFNQENRDKLVAMIKEKNVYELKNGTISYEGGRPILKVDVSIKPKSLVEVLKEYADITGIGNRELLNPDQYDGSNKFAIQVKVDMISHHLLEIVYPGETRKEVYKAYGLNREITLPSQTISIEELQGRIKR